MENKKVDNFVTKDQELAEKLQNDEGCVIIAVRTDPTDNLKEFTFEESKSEISKILGVKLTSLKEEEKKETPAEEDKGVAEEKKEPEKPKTRRRKRKKKKRG